MIKYKKGDLIDEANKYNIIIHGCNCFNTMGAGIALQIKQAFPKAYKVDSNTKKGDEIKLGKFTYHKQSDKLIIINAYTQYGYGSTEIGMCETNSKLYRENAIRESFKGIYKEFGNKGYKFSFPLIGSGLANGSWENISKIIEDEMPNEDLTCVVWDYDTDNINKFNL